jgi:putative tricarboxylic transport membrane protein
MNETKKREVLLGIVMLSAGLIYLFLTMSLPRRGFVDAAFVPYVLALAMCALGVLQLLAGRRLPSEVPSDTDAAAEAGPADYRTVLKTLGLIVGYIALLDPIGFPIMTAIYLFAQFIVLTPADKKINYRAYGLIAIVSSAVIFITFRYGFDLLLSAGLLAGIL